MKPSDINTSTGSATAEEAVDSKVEETVDSKEKETVQETEDSEKDLRSNSEATPNECQDDKVDNTEEDAAEQDPLEAAKAEIEELKKQALYKQAEFENYRKRTLKEKADLILGGAEKTVKEILPIMDDFERAMADKSDDPNAIRKGMELIYNKFQKTLESLGVKKIETEGADFNVDYHESIALVPGMGDDKKGKVIDCVQTGYTLNDKVIRFAKVAVGQ